MHPIGVPRFARHEWRRDEDIRPGRENVTGHGPRAAHSRAMRRLLVLAALLALVVPMLAACQQDQQGFATLGNALCERTEEKLAAAEKEVESAEVEEQALIRQDVLVAQTKLVDGLDGISIDSAAAPPDVVPGEGGAPTSLAQLRGEVITEYRELLEVRLDQARDNPIERDEVPDVERIRLSLAQMGLDSCVDLPARWPAFADL